MKLAPDVSALLWKYEALLAEVEVEPLRDPPPTVEAWERELGEGPPEPPLPVGWLEEASEALYYLANVLGEMDERCRKAGAEYTNGYKPALPGDEGRIQRALDMLIQHTMFLSDHRRPNSEEVEKAHAALKRLEPFRESLTAEQIDFEARARLARRVLKFCEVVEPAMLHRKDPEASQNPKRHSSTDWFPVEASSIQKLARARYERLSASSAAEIAIPEQLRGLWIPSAENTPEKVEGTAAKPVQPPPRPDIVALHELQAALAPLANEERESMSEKNAPLPDGFWKRLQEAAESLRSGSPVPKVGLNLDLSQFAELDRTWREGMAKVGEVSQGALAKFLDEREKRAEAKALRDKPAAARGAIVDGAMLTHLSIAEVLEKTEKKEKEAIRKTLDRWREDDRTIKKAGRDFIENPDRTENEPKWLYRWGSVKGLFRASAG